MGAGVTKKEATGIRYRMLNKVVSQLRRSGVDAQYENGAVSFDQGFVQVGSIHASNGEAVFFLRGVVNNLEGEKEIYDGFSRGHKVVDRIIELYGIKSDGVDFADLKLYATFTVSESRSTLGVSLEPGQVYRKTGSRRAGRVVPAQCGHQPRVKRVVHLPIGEHDTMTVGQVGLRSSHLKVQPVDDPSAKSFQDLAIGQVFRAKPDHFFWNGKFDNVQHGETKFVKESESTYGKYDRPFPLLSVRSIPVLNPDVKVYV